MKASDDLYQRAIRGWSRESVVVGYLKGALKQEVGQEKAEAIYLEAKQCAEEEMLRREAEA